jgi:glycosyltransferase involved in cell wall biosynthesis
VAKGARRPAGALHVSYTYTPMRYAWDLYEDYFGGWGTPLKSLVLPAIMGYLRRWDLRACGRVDHFVAISRHVAARIQRHYNREAFVVYPPVDVGRFRLSREPGSYYLMVSAFVPYKRIDLAVEAFTRLALPLKIVGWGPEERRLRSRAGPTVEFLGRRSDEELIPLYAGCRAVIFPGEEDFGIVPVEAQASGKPVIAYAKGGVLETLIPARTQDAFPTGVFFYEQTADSLVHAVQSLEKDAGRFEPARLRDHAMQFDRAIFKDRIRTFIEEKWQAFRPARHAETVQ